MGIFLQIRPMFDFVYFITDYIFHKLRLSAFFLKNKMNE